MATLQLRDTAAYVLLDQPQKLNVRDVAAYVLTVEPVTAAVRQAVPYVLRRKRTTNFAQSAETTLFAALKNEVGVTLTASQAQWVNPRAAPDNTSFDSLVDIKALPGSHLTGTFTFRYDRHRLASAFSGKDLSSFPVASATTVYALIPTINSKYNLALTQVDLVDGPVPAGNGVTLTAGATSLYFNPGTQVTLGTP